MSEQTESRQAKSRWTLIAVIVAFVAPILLAWWLARGGGFRADDQLLNHGTLIRPPVDIAAAPALGILETIPLAPGEWAIVALNAGTCAAACEATLGTLLTLKSLLGNAATRVRVALLADQPAPPREGLVLLVEPGARAALAQRLRSVPGATGDGNAIVFLDWRGQIMMFYPDAAAPAGIKRDLHRLLRASKIK